MKNLPACAHALHKTLNLVVWLFRGLQTVKPTLFERAFASYFQFMLLTCARALLPQLHHAKF